MRVLGGADIDPERRLEDLDTLALFLQKLKCKTQAGLIIAHCFIYESMIVKKNNKRKQIVSILVILEIVRCFTQARGYIMYNHTCNVNLQINMK